MSKFDRVLVLVFLVVLAVGMGSAAVLSSYGVIAGTAEVEGPTLYAAEVGGDDVLKINEPPTDDQEITYRKIGPDRSFEFFATEDIDSADWYPVQVDMFVEAKTYDGTDNGNIAATFGYIHDGSDYTICTDEIFVNSTEDYQEFNTSCTGTVDNPVDKFWYELKGGTTDEFEIQAKGETRVEVKADES